LSRLEFSFQELISEIEALRQIGGRFIAPESQGVLPALRESLNNIRQAKEGQKYQWRIEESWPLRTMPTRGYKRGGGSYDVFAAITSAWEVEPIGGHTAKFWQKRHFVLDGMASTRVRIFRNSPGNEAIELAMWRMEIADSASPGSYFHVQVMGETETFPFPNYLEVPRLPGLVATPMLVFEFVLGELFQIEWAKEAARESGSLRQWRHVQHKRFERFLSWQLRCLEKAGSPWAVLKASQPDNDLFVR
jgi:hypothetical protein